jgi:hypothetical protein
MMLVMIVMMGVMMGGMIVGTGWALLRRRRNRHSGPSRGS